MGADAIRTMLSDLDLEEMATALRTSIANETTFSRRKKNIKRLKEVEAFRLSSDDNKPEWMILQILPVLPPDLRPLVPLDGGRFASSDLNDLYRRVINRNNRLKRLLEETKYALRFIPHAPIITISALTGEKVFKIFPLVNKIYEQYQTRIPTSKLNQFFEEVTFKHEPPMYRNRRIKFYYATQASVAPPTIVIFCNYPDGIHFSYKRYLINEIRKQFSFDMIPVRLIFRART